ncbi:MAG TPA: hypothetical protein PLX09_02650 [Xanthomonadaceae bacterium]|nr:hypothetical protein [Xanthomonadaceae bacterium]
MRVVFFGKGGCHKALRVENVYARLGPPREPGRRIHCLTPWLDFWQQLNAAANDARGPGRGDWGYRR